MIDIHCHILPRIDDGPSTIDESIEMCKIAAADGVSTIVASPHYSPGVIEPDSTLVFDAIEALQREAEIAGIEVSILPGAEVAVNHELKKSLMRVEHLSINANKRYFLAELPHDTVLPRWDEHLLSMRHDGLIPVLTHPERNRHLISHPEEVVRYVNSGGLVQITAGSVLGDFGEGPLEASSYLLRNNSVRVIASDAHSSTNRTPQLSGALKAVADLIGAEAARALVYDNPAAIVEGSPLPALGAL